MISKKDWQKEADSANAQIKEAEKKIVTCGKIIKTCERIIEVGKITHEFYSGKAKV